MPTEGTASLLPNWNDRMVRDGAEVRIRERELGDVAGADRRRASDDCRAAEPTAAARGS
jgi:hypothetical protein